MFRLSSEVTIGNKKFEGINEVKIKRSVSETTATATIKLPVTAVIQQKDTPPANVEVAKEIAIGDKVEIQLGYDGILHTEFRGYVSQLNLKSPLEVVCEDEFFQTRPMQTKENLNIYDSHTITDILNLCGLQIGYATDLELDNFIVDGKPTSWVLGTLKDKYKLNVFFDTEGKVYVGDPVNMLKDKVKYRLRYNIVKDDKLTYGVTDKDVQKIKVNAVGILEDGTEVTETVGDEDGMEKTLTFYDVEDEAQLKTLAENEWNRLRYSSYGGQLETFLQPFAEPCMIATIEDEIYPEREGDYLISETEVTFGMNGGRRIVKLANRL